MAVANLVGKQRDAAVLAATNRQRFQPDNEPRHALLHDRKHYYVLNGLGKGHVGANGDMGFSLLLNYYFRQTILAVSPAIERGGASIIGDGPSSPHTS